MPNKKEVKSKEQIAFELKAKQTAKKREEYVKELTDALQNLEKRFGFMIKPILSYNKVGLMPAIDVIETPVPVNEPAKPEKKEKEVKEETPDEEVKEEE